jgi:hypothetical protein
MCVDRNLSISCGGYLFMFISIVSLHASLCLDCKGTMSCNASPYKTKINIPSQTNYYSLQLELDTTAFNNMFLSRSSAAGDRNAEDVKVWKLPVPWLVPICIFSPFFLTFILFILHRYTIKHYRDKKALAKQESGDIEVGRDVEMQVQKFLKKPEIVRHK